MQLLADIPDRTSKVEAPRFPVGTEMAGLRQFCKSMARVQEILCWAAVEHVLSGVEHLPTPPLNADVQMLCSTVRDFAHDLMDCNETEEALSKGHLDCGRVAAFVRLLGFLPQSQIAAALHTSHLRANGSQPAPFFSFAAFLLNVCDAVEAADSGGVLEGSLGD